MIAALFDFDGTLYTGHIWQDLVGHHRSAKRHRFWTAWYVTRNMAPMPLYKAGLLSKERFFHMWAETMAWLVRGWSVEESQALFEQLTDDRVMPNLREDVLAYVRRHQADGHLVALVSGAFAPWLGIVARRLDIPHAIGTPLEDREGRYTGRIIPPVCQGDGKAIRVSAYLAEHDIDIDWEASYAYADRETDLGLLSQVGHPTAVYPDEVLLAESEARGWPVIGELST
jgi:putative phosphoserine phosphatase/1-acylglycerol-3-phosphate O-acyltransferase